MNYFMSFLINNYKQCNAISYDGYRNNLKEGVV